MKLIIINSSEKFYGERNAYVKMFYISFGHFVFPSFFLFFHFLSYPGYYVLALSFLFMSDLVVGFLDIIVERKSRSFQGGLYSGEYLTHMLLSFHLGALYINLIPRMLKALALESSIQIVTPSNAAHM